MSLENGKCPSCGGTLLLDVSKEKAVCKFCGHEVIVQQAVQKVKVDGIADFDTLLISAQQAIDYDEDYDKARKKYREALCLNPNDYRILWGLYLCEIEAIRWAEAYHGFVQIPGDIISNIEQVNKKYGQKAIDNAPEEVKPYYFHVMQQNQSYFANKINKEEFNENSKSKTFAILALVFGAIGIPLGFVFGILCYSKTKNKKYRMVGIIGSILSVIWIVIYIILAVSSSK